MALNVIYGKSQSGKTQYIYDKIKNEYDNIIVNKKTYIIVPDQFALSVEERLSEFIGKNGLINLEVLTFKRMAYRALNHIGYKNNFLTDVGKKILIYNIISENGKKLKIFNKVNKGNVENIIDIFNEFNRYCVDIEKIKGLNYDNIYLKEKIDEIAYIYQLYTEKAKKLDTNHQLDILVNNISNIEILHNCDIYIDEFYGFTEQEMNVILNLSKFNNIYITFCVDNIELENNLMSIYSINKKAYEYFISKCKESNVEIKENNKIDNQIKKEDNIEFLASNLFSYPYNRSSSKIDNIEIYECQNAYIEIELIAQKISKLIDEKNYKYSDFIIITRDLTRYSEYIKNIFAKYNIPFFIDEKINIISNQISQLILSILDVFISNFSYTSVFAYLKANFLNIDLSDIHQLENYAIKWGIQGHKWFDDFTFENSNSENVNEKLEKINSLRQQIIDPLLKLKKEFENAKTAEQYVENLYNFLEENSIQSNIESKVNMFKELNLTTLEKEYTHIWDYYIQVFQEIINALNDQQISLQEFKNILVISLENTQRGYIPLYKDCVVIGDVEKTRTHSIRNIFFIGVNDGIFPITYATEGILTDKDREFLKTNEINIAKTTQQKTIEDQFNLYKILTMVTDNVFFSYIINDFEGKAYRPSFLISKIKSIININEKFIEADNLDFNYLYNPIVNVITAVNTNNTNLLNMYKEINPKIYNSIINIKNYSENMEIRLSSESIQLLYGDTLQGSISKLEEYVKCPYSFYLKYGLKVKERDVYSVRQIDIGNFNHQVIEQFFKYISEHNLDLSVINENEISKIIGDIIDINLSNIQIKQIKNAKNFAALKIRLKKTLMKAINILVLQIKGSSFKPIGSEVEFGPDKQYHTIEIELENNKKLSLVGKIDRIDIADTNNGKYIRIIDYKSSKKSMELSDVYNGLTLQLITYMDVVTQQSNDIIPGGVLYFKIDNPIISKDTDMSEEDIQSEIIKELRLNGLILKDKTLVTCMDNNIKGSSKLVNARINTDGEVIGKNVLDYDEFLKLQKYSRKLLFRIGQQILTGAVDIKPYFKDKNAYGCKYCQFNPICKFNPKEKKCKYNVMRKFSNEEIFKEI